MRTAISKRVRFEVFKRDAFKCMYCGAKPPKAPLEVDHILPVSRGGKNNVDNLITACFDCNRGKSNVLLEDKTEALTETMNRLKIAKKQHKEFLKALEDEHKMIEELVDKVEETYNIYFDDYYLKPAFRSSIKTFIKHLSLHDVIESMEIACSKIHDPNKSLKYFCGICWNKINGI